MNSKPKRPCTFCESLNHWPFMCPKKPRKRLNLEAPKAKTKRIACANRWFRLNPPDENGNWECYLQISTLCPKTLTRPLLSLEHVYPKVKRPDLKFNEHNIKPACSFCNKMKGSRTPEELAKVFAHIAIMISKPEWTAWKDRLPKEPHDQVQPVL